MSINDSESPKIRLDGIIGIEAATPGVEAATTVQRLSYRIFIAIVSLNALAVLFAYHLIPLPQAAQEVLRILDAFIGVIFIGDFLLRLFSTPHKSRYVFIEWGWVDLLGSLPIHPLLRLLRIMRSLGLWLRIVRSTDKEVRDEARRRLAESTLFVVAAIAMLLVTAGSLAIALIEPEAAGANIHTGSDAIWYVMATIATVGYGDKYPVTNAGRVVGVTLMVLGVSVFSVLTSFIASRFLARGRGEA